MRFLARWLGVGLVAASASAQTPAAPRLARELTLGTGKAGDAPGGFTTISRIHVGTRGEIYVEQAKDNNIRVFDSTGTFLRDIGRKGRGPGETEWLAMSGLAGDTLWTVEGSTHRFSFFNRTGALLHGVTVPSVEFRRFFTMGATALAGPNVVYAGPSYAASKIFEGLPPMPILVGTRGGSIKDTLAIIANAAQGQLAFRAGKTQMFRSHEGLELLVSTKPLVVVGGRGKWIGVALPADCEAQEQFLAVRLSASLDTLWKGALPCPRVPIPARFADSVGEPFASAPSMRAQGFGAKEIAEAVQRSMGTSKVFAPAADLVVGLDGSMWLRRVGDRKTPEEWFRADAPAGRPAHLTLPPKAHLLAVVDPARIWVSERDDDDVQTVVRYRVTK